MSALHLALQGECPEGWRRCTSSASPPAAPVMMSQALSAHAHGGQSSRGPSQTSHEHHQHGSSAVRDAPLQSSVSLCPYVSPTQILNQGTFTFSQSQLHDRLCNTLGKYWLGSNRLKIFGLRQMWCVRIFETLAKGVIWENKNCRWVCLLCKVVHIVPRCQKCAWRFHPQEESQL